jgi:hypothetical protein
MKTLHFWKRLLCFLLSLTACLTFAACGSSQPTDHPSDPPNTEDPADPNEPDKPNEPGEDKEDPPMYTTPISEVIISSGDDRLAVNFCREDLVHFRYAPNGDEFAPEDAVPESIAKFDGDYADVCGEIEETDGTTIIRTEILTVTVDHATLGILVTDLEGNEIFKSAAEAFSSNGQSKTANFTRDVATTEHFFGLGNAKGALALSTARQGSCMIPILFPLAWLFGAEGIASVQAVADVLSIAIAVPIILHTIRKIKAAMEAQKLAN